MRKLLLSALVLLMFPGLALASFPDVFPTNPNLDAINYVQAEGIVDGYPNGEYRPWFPINRAEFVKILVNTKYDESEISACNDRSFSDVPGDEWYLPYVCIAARDGIIDGYPDGTFKGENEVNFAEAAKILVNTMELGLEHIPPAEWYIPYVSRLSSLNAVPVSVTGFDDYVDRQLMAEMVYRLDAGITTKTSLNWDEIDYQNKIRIYYDKISWDKFDEAYAMKHEPEMSLEAFETMYDDFSYATITDYEKEGDHLFSFYVITNPDPDTTASERFAVTMEIVDGKLKTESAVEINADTLEDVSFSDSLRATIEWDNGYYRVYIIEDGNKEMIAEYERDMMMCCVSELTFSPDGKYLTYHIAAWEYRGVYLYDIENKVLNDRSFHGEGLYGFVNNDSQFYYCSPSGMGSGDLFVMDLPGFYETSLETAGDGIGECGPFDSDKNILVYELGIWNDMMNDFYYQTYEYDLDDETITEIEV